MPKKPPQDTSLGQESIPTDDLVLLDIDGNLYAVCAAKIPGKKLAKSVGKKIDLQRRTFKGELRFSPHLDESKKLKLFYDVSIVPASKRAEQGAIDELINRAAEVLGSRDEAMRWLGTPVRGLDFATPISLLATKEGAERVSDILGQMEHGIW